jgi:hypothetical protein
MKTSLISLNGSSTPLAFLPYHLSLSVAGSLADYLLRGVSDALLHLYRRVLYCRGIEGVPSECTIVRTVG